MGTVMFLMMSSVARCLLVTIEESSVLSEQTTVIRTVQGRSGQAYQQSEPVGQDTLAEIESTAWKSDYGKSTFIVFPGGLVEKKEAE